MQILIFSSAIIYANTHFVNEFTHILLKYICMFGKRLKELRLEQGITQKELANALSCNQSMITRWERCECEPTESIIKVTALYFNVSTDYLLGLEDDFGNKTYTAPTSDNRHHNVNVYNVTGNHNKF